MSDLLIIPQIPSLPALSVTNEAARVKNELLHRSTEILKVDDVSGRDLAIRAAAKIATQLKAIEKARVEAKRPFFRFGQNIDHVTELYVKDLEAELTRLNALIGIFEDHRRTALQVEEERLEREQRENAEAASSYGKEIIPEERKDALYRAIEAEEASDRAGRQIVTLRAQEGASRPSGGALRLDWDIEIIDLHELYLAHPQCVELTPRKLAIKDLLRAGITPPGVKVRKVAAFATRAS